MKFYAPKPVTWGIAAITGITGMLFQYQILKIPFFEPYGFWMVVFATLLLAAGCLTDSL